MAEIEKTPTLGLNKPPKGYFDWDVPLNENWDKLDFLGAGQLPLLTPMMFDHRLEGEEALGWAMQGSVLDGDEYNSVWEKLKTARDRAAQQTLEINKVTYTIFKDATSGWVFLDSANYNKAFENLKDSLGFILVDADGKKTITLPKREVYLKPSLSDVNVFGAESLPNIKGSVNSAGAMGWVYNASWSGAFKNGGTTRGYGPNAGGASTKDLSFDASLYDARYQDGAKVNPDHSTVFIYYKVGNTIVGKEEIDLGNLTTQVEDLATNKADKDLSNISSNIDYVVEQDANYIKFKSGKLIQWGYVGGVVSMSTTITYPKPFSAVGYVGAFPDTSADPTTNVYSITNTNFKVKFSGGGTYNIRWFAIGQGA